MSRQVKPPSDETRKTGEDAGSAADKRRGYPGPGPGKVGLVSDDAPGLVARSGVNQRDRARPGQPAEVVPDRNGPSDPDSQKSR